jgi:hypothetical protein
VVVLLLAYALYGQIWPVSPPAFAVFAASLTVSLLMPKLVVLLMAVAFEFWGLILSALSLVLWH